MPTTATVSPGAEPAGSRHLRGDVEAVGHGEQFGQHGDVGRQSIGHTEHRCARTQVEELGPAAEQERRLGTCQRVAVVLQSPAEVVRVVAEAELAFTARPVRSRHDTVADSQRRAVERRCPAIADRGDDADVLVPLDDGKRCRGGVIGAGVLLRLAAKRVLVGAADAGREHLQQHRAGLESVGIRKALQLELPGGDEGGSEHVGGHRRMVGAAPASPRSAMRDEPPDTAYLSSRFGRARCTMRDCGAEGLIFIACSLR